MASSAGRGFQRLFVGNLPWTIGHRELRSYFEEFGRVLNANVIFDKKTGNSKGYGFIAFLDKNKFIENLDKKSKHILEGNLLNIQKQNQN